jgi:phosphoenolpyruvate-protein kinase (PTS system EI component)
MTADAALAWAAKIGGAALAGGVAYGMATSALDSKAPVERVAVVEEKVSHLEKDIPAALERIERKIDRIEDKLDGKVDKP